MSSLTWLGLTADALNAEVAKRQNISATSTLSITEELSNLREELRGDFQRFWLTGEYEPGIEAHGFTVARFVREFRSTPIAAFLNMNWIMREPDAAIAAIQRGKHYSGVPLR